MNYSSGQNNSSLTSCCCSAVTTEVDGETSDLGPCISCSLTELVCKSDSKHVRLDTTDLMKCSQVNEMAIKNNADFFMQYTYI